MVWSFASVCDVALPVLDEHSLLVLAHAVGERICLEHSVCVVGSNLT